jgi:hypothetical protein
MPSDALTVLNVAILLFAVFFFTSTLASHALEAIVGLVNSRGRQLRRRLEVALGPEVAAEIYASPLIRSLAGDGEGKDAWRSPSYIEPAFFARAVAALYDGQGVETGGQAVFRSLREEADRDGSTAAFEARIVEWYEALNDRQSGTYTRWSTGRLFLIGLLLAAALDIDAVHIGGSLWGRPEVAENLVTRFEGAVPALRSGDAAAVPEAVRSELANAVAAAWPAIRAEAQPRAYGWQKGFSDLTAKERWGKALGWLLTALATSLGAQFWFRALSESLKLRAAGRRPRADVEAEAPGAGAPAGATVTAADVGRESLLTAASATAGVVHVSDGRSLPVGEPLGLLSSKYEVGGRGPGTVSSGVGDAGGVSYGSYQMTSEPGGGTVARFVGDAGFPWRDRFAGLTPGGGEFTARWKALAAEAPDAFFEAQHAFIKRTHYDPLVRKAAEEKGLDLALRSNALQNVVWSTAVQHGARTAVVGRAVDDVTRKTAVNGSGFDRELIRAVYAERGRRGADGALVYFRRNSAKVQAGVARRFVDEERDALRMLAGEARPRVEEEAA